VVREVPVWPPSIHGLSCYWSDQPGHPATQELSKWNCETIHFKGKQTNATTISIITIKSFTLGFRLVVTLSTLNKFLLLFAHR